MIKKGTAFRFLNPKRAQPQPQPPADGKTAAATAAAEPALPPLQCLLHPLEGAELVLPLLKVRDCAEVTLPALTLCRC